MLNACVAPWRFASCVIRTRYERASQARATRFSAFTRAAPGQRLKPSPPVAARPERVLELHPRALRVPAEVREPMIRHSPHNRDTLAHERGQQVAVDCLDATIDTIAIRNDEAHSRNA